MQTIKPEDWNTIANALRVASDQYDKDASAMSEASAPLLRRQFAEQADDARRLAAIADENACG